MNEMRHTPEPWRFNRHINSSGVFSDIWSDATGHKTAGYIYNDADGERIVACVNACAGINPEAVPLLLGSLKGLIWRWESCHGEEVPPDVSLARTAITKATGGN